MLLLVLVVPLFTAYFMYEIARYDRPSYRFCGFLTIIGFLRTIGHLDNGRDILIDLLFVGIVAGLSFYLESQMLPDYSPKYLMKDSNGEYIFNETNDR